MLAQCARASRQTLVRVARQQTAFTFRRTYVPTAVRSADLVQDLYLRELKAYKPVAISASDAEGHVQKFAVPKAPASPEETDIASGLSEYQSQAVEVEGSGSGASGAAVEQDWFVEEEEEDGHAAH